MEICLCVFKFVDWPSLPQTKTQIHQIMLNNKIIPIDIIILGSQEKLVESVQCGEILYNIIQLEELA